MKLKTLAFLLSLIMMIGILSACTPKPQDSAETNALPEIASETAQLPDSETAGATNETVGPENESAPVGAGSENVPAATDAQPEDPDEEGMEIESGYTVVVDDNLGVGGN